MELVLGTVQFGLAYGIAGSGARVDDTTARAILELAWASGIRTLDTAPAYGDIEERLAGLCEGLDFRTVSKISSIGPDKRLDEAWLLQSLQQSLQRLGSRLSGVLFHHAQDLNGAAGHHLWSLARDWTRSHGVALGSSGYTPQELRALHQAHSLDFVQLPGNALDQRIHDHGVGTREVHLRSCFLQGLLLMPQAEAERKLPAAAPALRGWHAWLRDLGLTPVAGALSVVKGFREVTHCVIGVDCPDQLADIVQAWATAEALPARALSSTDLDVIDPRRWKMP